MTVKVIQASHCYRAKATLGEGALWDAGRGALWFVDIAQATIHRWSPQTGEHARWKAPAKVGWVAPADGQHLVAGLADGLYRLTLSTGEFKLLQRVESDRPNTRINDGARDARGNCWFGTMSAGDGQPAGRFYRYDGHTLFDIGIPPMRITNGPAVSMDGRILYAVDTLERRVLAYPIGPDFVLGAMRVLTTIAPDDGYPDGVTCDAAGGVWVGLWNGWAARRYDAQGRLTDEVRFPVANVTKVALGGPDGRTGYATTAREGQDGDTSGHQPLGGDLFRFPVSIGSGLP